MKQIHQKLSIILLIFTIIVLAGLNPAAAQEAIQVKDQSWDANFREHLTFRLNAESSAEIVEASLFYRVVGQLATSRNQADFTPGTSIEAEFVIDQTDPANYQPPGTELEYWWRITDADGNELRTERETLLYLDNRYDWQTLENGRLTIYWYEGEDSFGEALFERANLALDTLETDIGISLENPIKIFIYASHQDLLGAIRVGSQEWTGGQAFADYGVVVIGIHPTQLNWGLNAMTHEMSHLVIHQATKNPFGGLPVWLDEGIAVYNENRDNLDEDFRGTFERAVKEDRLMTLRSLSSPFPADPLQVNLAYGQSGAVVKYIVDTYGSEAMAELLAIFAEGALYDEALEQALGVNMDELDNGFRASLGLSPLPGTETESAPQTEIDVVEEENSEAVNAAEVAEPVPTPAEDQSAAPAPPAEQPAAQGSESVNNPVGSLSCVAGLLFLMIMGIGVYRVYLW